MEKATITLAIDAIWRLGKWSNENQGIVSVGLFATTLLLGWVSGIFSGLRRRPDFRIALLDGPTFSCTFPTGKKNEEYDFHKTGIALYLKITNVGSAASSVDGIAVGYHWDLRPFSKLWVRYCLGWFWLQNQAIALTDFQVAIGKNIKFYPFLTQQSSLSPTDSQTFIMPGMMTNGVVYFEQAESWGGCYPIAHGGIVQVNIRVIDSFGRNHTKKFKIPAVDLESARKYNPNFGRTYAELHGESCP